MAFFGLPTAPITRQPRGAVSLEFLHRHECAACPLNNESSLNHPKMEPTGSQNPDVYILGEAPTDADDRRGRQMVSPEGAVLRHHLPERWLSRVRWNNCIRTHPPKGRSPAQVELECCFPAGTVVGSIGEVRSSYKRWYDGPLVTIKTAGGRILTGTPNHPIFTTKGKVSLQSVEVGDHAFCAVDLDDGISGGPDVHNEPTPIEKIFESVAKVGQVKRVCTTALDFHGDATSDGHVDIVRTACELRGNFKFGAFSKKQFNDPIFTPTNSAAGFLVGLGALNAHLSVFAMVAALPSFFCTFCRHPKSHLSGGASDRNSVRFKYFDNLRRGCIKFIRNLLGAFPASVLCNNSFCRQEMPSAFTPPKDQFFTFGSERDPIFTEELLDSSDISASLSFESTKGSTVAVELDEIVSVETVSNFRGHVYNLETGNHKYIAQGFIVGNCRPSIERDIERTKPKAIFGFGNTPLSWAGVADNRVNIWSGRRIPVKIGSHSCWYFPMLDLAAIARDPKWRGIQRKKGRYGSEHEFRLAIDLRAALAAVDAGLPEPVVHTEDDVFDGVEWVTGSGGDADVERIEEFLESAAQRKIAGFDYETNKLRPYSKDAKILTASVTTARDGTLAFPFDHREAKWTGSQRQRVRAAWRKFLHESECLKVSQNLPFELEWSGFFFGVECLHSGRWGCSYSQAYVMDERQGASNLGDLTMTYFGINIKTLSGVDVEKLDAEPLAHVLKYNGGDSKYHLALFLAQRAELKRQGLLQLYHEHLERVPTVVLTQLKGIPIDQDVVLELGRKYSDKMGDIADEIHALPEIKRFVKQTGQKFRISAPDDIRYVANKILGYKLGSVDEEALGTVDHEFADLVLRWRKLSKLFGTYITPLADQQTRDELELTGLKKPPQVFPDGNLHPITSVNRTSTSRTGSEDPNYQNFPKRGGNNAIEVRRTVKAKPIRKTKRLVVSFDYGQIQARNVGMESLDNALLEAFWEDYDIHTDFMEHLVRLYPRWVKEGAQALLAKDETGGKLRKKYRNEVKHGFVFASFFGAGPGKSATVLNIPLQPAEKLADIFWDRFGGIKDWHGRLEDEYYRTGYVTGHAGYRRHAPVSYNERINAPIQADESKIVLDAMARLSKLDHDYLQANMEIHDDLTFIWEVDKVEELAPIVIREMLTVPFDWARTTPIVVEMNVGEDWANLRAPVDSGFPDFGKGEFASHKYEGIDMPRRRPI